MFVVYGTHHFKRIKGHSKNSIQCNHCGKVGQWQYIHVWTWFTLFFIPLFPVFRQKMFVCPGCEWGVKINRQNRDSIMAAIELKK